MPTDPGVESLTPIPFDSLVLRAVVAEIEPHVGSKVQRIAQPDPKRVSIALYGKSGEACLFVCVDPESARVHLSARRVRTGTEPPGFCRLLRARIGDARLVSVRQINADRVVEFGFVGPAGAHSLVVEIIGKKPNAALLDAEGAIVGLMQPGGRSGRVLRPGRAYEPPPAPRGPDLTEVQSPDQVRGARGASPFLARWAAAAPDFGAAWADLLARIQTGAYDPCLALGYGAYPVSVAPMGYDALRRDSISVALEQHFGVEEPRRRTEQLKKSLLAQLERVRLARETAIDGLRQALTAADRARRLQLEGELVLAYAATLAPGAATLEAWDYEGNPIVVQLNPELTPLENAQRLFERAKHAKSRRGEIADQLARLEADWIRLDALIERVGNADAPAALESLLEEARDARYLHPGGVDRAGKTSESRPFDGHRVKELAGPAGYTVYVGENATANDYLTTRMGKSNDWWLHVRGDISAHVLVPTGNRPERVPREVLEYAARQAALHSPQKHASVVAVDVTLKKHVRKPKGAPVGTALYTHEKTIHVDLRGTAAPGNRP
ncbi:MAG: NFACT family protein [Fimbriimonadaceae bacterium]